MSLIPPNTKPETKIVGKGGKGMRGVARAILALSNEGKDFVEWCMSVWKDVDAPMEWRWRAFEWLTNRSLGTQVTATVMQIQTVPKTQADLRSLSEGDIARIDEIFKKSQKETIDVD